MGKLIHAMVRAPFLTLMAFCSLLMIVGLVASALKERRQRRKMDALIAQARKRQRQPEAQVIVSPLAPVAEPAKAGASAVGRYFTGFRWPVAVLAVVCVVGIVIWGQTRNPAPGAARPPSGGNSAEARDGSETIPLANDSALRLWYTNFSAVESQPVGFHPGSMRLWGIDTAEDAPVPINVSQPLRATSDWKLPTTIDASRVDAVHPDEVVDYTPSKKLPQPR
jgi:hypothetical protein